MYVYLRRRTSVYVCVLCCVFINRCQCGAALAGQTVSGNSMSERRGVIEHAQQNQSQMKKIKENLG